MRDEPALGRALAVRKPILLEVPAEFRHKLAAPAEAGGADGEVFGLVLLERFDEVVDSWPCDAGSAEEHEWDEEPGGVEDVAYLGKGEARGCDGFHGVHEIGWEDHAWAVLVMKLCASYEGNSIYHP